MSLQDELRDKAKLYSKKGWHRELLERAADELDLMDGYLKQRDVAIGMMSGDDIPHVIIEQTLGVGTRIEYARRSNVLAKRKELMIQLDNLHNILKAL